MGSSSSKPARKLGSEVASSVARAVPYAVKPSSNPNPTPAPSASGKARVPPTEYGAQTAKQGAQFAPSASNRREQETQRQQQQASETKNADIMRDAYDPQFLQNLSRLGQVKVPKNATNYQPTDQMLRILEARERANLDNLNNAEALSSLSSSSSTISPAKKSSAQPRISATTITLLLDDRKHCESRKDLERLAVEYDLPFETIESLAKYYNSPTMGEEVRDEQLEWMKQEDQANRQEERAPPKVHGVWVVPKLQNQISA
ncbi:uncharacterized protein MEPE_01808 [Melanopsichium pennsylvanicum]|uniref:Uncharacterized protein n=2 Tax=Melanopsichium pennsylvanicum TaxID=63383 RepID=A0AAJ5C3Z7_9BASI|nr:conserved hypothetical protein [Melanopsichium pennsylvanicum 4]SNX83102.1 uncharacterized protein MEPE_01808 [Melanopsichium pennsylvanicum]